MIGKTVKINDDSFVKSNGSVYLQGIVVKSMWCIIGQPELYGGVAKIHLYEVRFDDGMSMLFPIESLSIVDAWKLTDRERDCLTEADRKKYDTAILYRNHDWACGPYGGWVRGNELLEELGWTKQTRTEGHRQFVSLVKPQL